MPDALVIVPAFMREPPDLSATITTLESVRATEPDVELLVVDDGSPADGLVDELAGLGDRLQFELHRQATNEGFSHAVNVGLRRALANHQSAVLLNADVEIQTEGWLQKMYDTSDSQGRPAAVVGALLTYPNGLVQHAGIFFSFLTRTFDHRFRFAPEWLGEVLEPARCPVTAAFQLIRLGCLETCGIYDERYRMGYEDVQYCLRVFEAGFECMYMPEVKAIHYESLFRARADQKLADWQLDSLRRLLLEHASTNLAQFVPEIV